jgi:hypothetical protein
MRLSTLAAGLFSLSLIVAGCSSTDSPAGGTGGSSGTGGSGTGGSATGGSGTGGSGTGGSGSATGGTSGNDAGGGTVTYADVKPIFMAKCTPCHATGGAGAGAHKLAESADDATKASYSCSGKKKGECTIVRVKAGTMPAITPKCTGNPATDAANSKCLTEAEQEKLQAWVDGGLK